MVTGIIGKVGSGKSLKATGEMLDHFVAGGFAATNIELDLDGVARYCWKRGHRFHPSQYQLLNLHDRPLFHHQIKRGTDKVKARIYLDECHLIFPASEYRANAADFREVDWFTSQHRKFDCDIFLITQAWENLWGQIKRQATFIVSCRDMRLIKLPLVGNALGGALGLKWTVLDAASNTALQTGSTSLSTEIFSCYSTKQVYDPMCRALMEKLEIHQPTVRRVGFWERRFRKPPPLCLDSSSSSAA